MKLQDTKVLYSVAEAADLLSLSRGTVYKLIQSGRLVAVYPTSKARISNGSLNRFVEQLERENRETSSVMWKAFQ
jgi:excisionase family DNA binding protein